MARSRHTQQLCTRPDGSDTSYSVRPKIFRGRQQFPAPVKLSPHLAIYPSVIAPQHDPRSFITRNAATKLATSFNCSTEQQDAACDPLTMLHGSAEDADAAEMGERGQKE